MWVWKFKGSGKTISINNSGTKPRGEEILNMKIESSAFANDQTIPKKYTCDGEGVNPPLLFMDVPKTAASLALIVDDPDAPMGPWTHWTLWNIDSNVASIAENSVPVGVVQGQTSFGQNVYGGPCPPSNPKNPAGIFGGPQKTGSPHRYFFKLYALDSKLKIPSYSASAELTKAMEGHIVAQAELMGTYGRSK